MGVSPSSFKPWEKVCGVVFFFSSFFKFFFFSFFPPTQKKRQLLYGLMLAATRDVAALLTTPLGQAVVERLKLPLLESLAGLHRETRALLHPQQTLRLWHCFLEAAAPARAPPGSVSPT